MEVNDLLEQLNEGLEELTLLEIKFLNMSFKQELKYLLDKYNCEIGIDILDNGSQNIITITSEISHYEPEVLIKGNLEFKNIKSNML